MSENQDMTLNPPEGWSVQKSYFGAIFRLVIDVENTRYADRSKRWIVELHWFSSSGEVKLVGPAMVNKKNRADSSNYPVPIAIFMLGQAKLFELTTWLRTVLTGGRTEPPQPEAEAASAP